jgi:hypothetical protein
MLPGPNQSGRVRNPQPQRKVTRYRSLLAVREDQKSRGMIAHGPENVLYVDWDNPHLGGAVPPGADLYGMASYDRGLVSAKMGELGRTHRSWWPRCFRV